MASLVKIVFIQLHHIEVNVFLWQEGRFTSGVFLMKTHNLYLDKE